MPYSKSNLPDHVKKLGAKQQRQWMHIVNGCLSDGKAESKCFAMANGVVKGKDLDTDEVALVAEAKDYQYVDSWEYSEHKLSQQQAGYNPLGATDTQGCANCQWFIGPSRCILVDGDISPTGLSNLWLAQQPAMATPMLVQIVDGPTPVPVVGSSEASTPDVSAEAGGSSWVDRTLSAVKSALLGVPSDVGSALHPPVLGTRPFSLVKQKDGRTRFFTAWSNNFEDREGEVFPEYAHKEFIEWADTNQQYPELWVWHTKGTRYGQVDWLDYTDGFVFASGLIDQGKETLAEQFAKEDSGVSHGFAGIQRGNEIVQYRSWEISTLPRTNAAVWTTSFDIMQGAEQMAFTQQKKDYLKQHGMSDDQIATAETNATNLSKSLRDLGVSWKDADIVEEPSAQGTASAAPAAAATTASPTSAQPAVAANTMAVDAGLKEYMAGEFAKITAAVAEVATATASLNERVKAVEKTDDEKVAAAMTARAASGQVVQASKAANNVVDGQAVSKDQDWFSSQFLAGLGVATSPAAVAANS